MLHVEIGGHRIQRRGVPTVKQQRLDALDVLRSLAALAVVMIHTSAAVLLHTKPQTRGFQAAALMNQGARFAVPAFVLITGAALFYNYGERDGVSWTRYFWQRLKGLGLPYLFWSAVYFSYYRWQDRDFTHLLPGFLAALASAGAIYTFYYFPIIVPFYLLFPLVRPLARSRWRDWIALCAILANGLLMWFSFPQPKFRLGPLLSNIYGTHGYLPFWWMGPFFLGAWLVFRWTWVTAWARRYWVGLAALAGVLLVWVMREFYDYVRIGRLAYVATNFRPSAYWYGIIFMLAAVGAGQALWERRTWLNGVVKELSRYSFAIYLIHPLAMEATATLLDPLDLGPLVHFGVRLCLVIGMSYVGARVISRVPGGGWVIGIR